MKIYKVRAIVNYNKNGNPKRDYDYEEIIIDNLETAKEIYRQQKNKLEYSAQYSGYYGVCELFIPKIHKNGCIAYFPYDEQTYIDRCVVE